MASTSEPVEAKRRPYLGSCHCRFTRYIAWLTLPASPPYDPVKPFPQLIRKCNCTSCHKLGFFHVRLADAPRDFALLSPTDPHKELSDYVSREGNHMFFCPRCGVRCFFIYGPSEAVGRDLAADGVDVAKAGLDPEKKTHAVWRPRAEGWKEEEEHWFRVNAMTLEAGQEGLDLREWTDKKWVQYVNMLPDYVEPGNRGSYEKPFEGGCY
jgi:hypothetical protein